MKLEWEFVNDGTIRALTPDGYYEISDYDRGQLHHNARLIETGSVALTMSENIRIFKLRAQAHLEKSNMKTMIYKMEQGEYYGVVYLPSEIFDRLNTKFFIPPSTVDMKYMCANYAETLHLQILGVDTISCDWYRIHRCDKPKVTKWIPTTNLMMLRRCGKTQEDISELGAVLARCIIQGIDEIDPGSGKVNRARLTEEIADVYAQLDETVKHLGLDKESIESRRASKIESMRIWEAMFSEDNNE